MFDLAHGHHRGAGGGDLAGIEVNVEHLTVEGGEEVHAGEAFAVGRDRSFQGVTLRFERGDLLGARSIVQRVQSLLEHLSFAAGARQLEPGAVGCDLGAGPLGGELRVARVLLVGERLHPPCRRELGGGGAHVLLARPGLQQLQLGFHRA